ncbi:MAG: peptide ABC transporter substrate-binding protein [Planctomycetota bacterium]|jgi:oligopeptide transport system substrate-binding protein
MKLLAPFAALLGVLAVVLHLDDAPPRADLVFANRGEIFTLDPQRMSWLQDFRMAYALYEGLARWNNADYSLEPATATAWEVSPDGLTYTFAIRADARWSNGDPVTAHDFVYAWRRALLPDTAADYSGMFFLIAGAEAFFAWRTEALADFAARASDLDPDERASRAMSLWAETERRFERTVSVRALGDRALQVTLTRPVPYFLDLLAFGAFHPVYRPSVEGWRIDAATAEALRRHGWASVPPPPFADRRFAAIDPTSGRFEQQHGWTKPRHLVCNGPYMLHWWRYKRGLYLEANPFYHSPQRISTPTVACVSIEDINTAVLAFESGRVDWLTDVGTDYQADMIAERLAYEKQHADEFSALVAAGHTIDEALAALPAPRHGQRRDIHVFPAFGTDFYSFNCRPRLTDGRDNPFAEPRVRRAFALSADKRALVEQVTRLHEPVLSVLIPPGTIAGYRSPEGLPYDPGRARAELQAAGWADRDGDGLIENARGEAFPVVDLLYSTNSPRYKNISLALRDMWQRELGLRVELRGKENKFFKEDLKSGNFMIGRGGWYGDYGDPTTYLDMCRTEDGNNDRGYSNPAVDDLLERASRELDPQHRLELLTECERIIVEQDVPMLLLCQYVQVYLYDPGKLTGLSQHPRLTQYLWQMKVHDQ